MLFIVVLVVSAVLIAGAAAFFSVYGLAQVFAGAFISVVIMGVALEVGKLVAASFLYRYWNGISLLLKAYLIAAVVVLMSITSMGISGYLTAAYQTETVGLKDVTNQVEVYSAELDRLLARKKEMDRQVSQLPADYVAARQKLMKAFESEYSTINPKIVQLQSDISSLRQQQLTTEAKVGPIVFISRVLGAETDDAIFWLVLLIVCVFDPLAVALTIAANIAIAGRLKRDTAIVEEAIESIPVTAVETPETVIQAMRRQVVNETAK